jgi:beta-glucanase (GH16 family)
MKKIIVLLQCILLFSCSKEVRLTTTPDQPEIRGEKYVNEIFYEGFDGPIDNKIWHVGTWKEHGGQLSADRCYVKDGLLNMIFINDPEKGYLSSAIETRDKFLYGRWEASLKPSSVPGVLNSFFTIDWNNTADPSSNSNGTKQEIDFEFLTKSFVGNTGEVHIAIHAAGKKSFGVNPDTKLDFNPSLDFHVWGFDVTPEYVEWFVNGKPLHRYIYSQHDITIDSPYNVKFNVWSSEKWIGGPPEENVECVYQIDWIRFTPLDQLKSTLTP